MKSKKHNNNIDTNPSGKEKVAGRKYSKPVLLCLGDLRTLTLGPSIGGTDISGGGWPENTNYPPI